MIKLFDVQDNVVIPTEHTYTLKDLNNIREAYPSCYLEAYAYVFYMTCPNPEFNPFFEVHEEDKEELIFSQLNAICFSPEDEVILKALELCRKLYETPTYRAYKGIKSMLDRLAEYMENTEITHGRDGNINSMVAAAKNFQAIRESFKGTFKDLQEEQSQTTRGGQRLAYDQ